MAKSAPWPLELFKANCIRCEECNATFFFDFLRHPRYFVTHFKTCHLRNCLYRFNGHSEEENQRIRFGPRRKKDAHAWFSQLKSTEKRMISMQDNKWSEISECESWSCRLCHDGKTDRTHVFDRNDAGLAQALQHLRQVHGHNAQMPSETETQTPAGSNTNINSQPNSANVSTAVATTMAAMANPSTMPPGRTMQQRLAEAERSRLRRQRATPEDRRLEALRSQKRREQLTPAQRQADYERRKRKQKRREESERSRKRREDAGEAIKEKELLRSRERRRNATEEQREREAQRSKLRREKATETQKLKERERCRRRYEQKKLSKRQQRQGEKPSGTSDEKEYSAEEYPLRAVAAIATAPQISMLPAPPPLPSPPLTLQPLLRHAEIMDRISGLLVQQQQQTPLYRWDALVSAPGHLQQQEEHLQQQRQAANGRSQP